MHRTQVDALPWDADVKILLHIADAPAHGDRFNGGVGDNYRTESYPEPRERPEALLRSLATKKVDQVMLEQPYLERRQTVTILD